jgi:hypothetical protein
MPPFDRLSTMMEAWNSTEGDGRVFSSDDEDSARVTGSVGQSTEEVAGNSKEEEEKVS